MSRQAYGHGTPLAYPLGSIGHATDQSKASRHENDSMVHKLGRASCSLHPIDGPGCRIRSPCALYSAVRRSHSSSIPYRRQRSRIIVGSHVLRLRSRTGNHVWRQTRYVPAHPASLAGDGNGIFLHQSSCEAARHRNVFKWRVGWLYELCRSSCSGRYLGIELGREVSR